MWLWWVTFRTLYWSELSEQLWILMTTINMMVRVTMVRDHYDLDYQWPWTWRNIDENVWKLIYLSICVKDIALSRKKQLFPMFLTCTHYPFDPVIAIRDALKQKMELCLGNFHERNRYAQRKEAVGSSARRSWGRFSLGTLWGVLSSVSSVPIY